MMFACKSDLIITVILQWLCVCACMCVECDTCVAEGGIFAFQQGSHSGCALSPHIFLPTRLGHTHTHTLPKITHAFGWFFRVYTWYGLRLLTLLLQTNLYASLLMWSIYALYVVFVTSKIIYYLFLFKKAHYLKSNLKYRYRRYRQCQNGTNGFRWTNRIYFT